MKFHTVFLHPSKSRLGYGYDQIQEETDTPKWWGEGNRVSVVLSQRTFFIFCGNVFPILSPNSVPWHNRDPTRVVFLFLIIRTSKASSGMMMIRREIMNQRNFSMEFRWDYIPPKTHFGWSKCGFLDTSGEKDNSGAEIRGYNVGLVWALSCQFVLIYLLLPGTDTFPRINYILCM